MHFVKLNRYVNSFSQSPLSIWIFVKEYLRRSRSVLLSTTWSTRRNEWLRGGASVRVDQGSGSLYRMKFQKEKINTKRWISKNRSRMKFPISHEAPEGMNEWMITGRSISRSLSSMRFPISHEAPFNECNSIKLIEIIWKCKSMNSI